MEYHVLRLALKEALLAGGSWRQVGRPDQDEFVCGSMRLGRRYDPTRGWMQTINLDGLTCCTEDLPGDVRHVIDVMMPV